MCSTEHTKFQFNHEVYKSVTRSSLGESDHAVILLIPTYKQKLKTSKPVSVSVDKWDGASIELLRDCFERTNWCVFRDVWSSIHEVTDVMTRVCHSAGQPANCRQNSIWPTRVESCRPKLPAEKNHG